MPGTAPTCETLPILRHWGGLILKVLPGKYTNAAILHKVGRVKLGDPLVLKELSVEVGNPKERMGTAGPSRIVRHFSELNTLRPTDKLWSWDKYYAWRRDLWAYRGYYPKVSKVTGKNEIIKKLSVEEYRNKLWEAAIDQEQNAKLAGLRGLLDLKKL